MFPTLQPWDDFKGPSNFYGHNYDYTLVELHHLD